MKIIFWSIVHAQGNLMYYDCERETQKREKREDEDAQKHTNSEREGEYVCILPCILNVCDQTKWRIRKQTFSPNTFITNGKSVVLSKTS